MLNFFIYANSSMQIGLGHVVRQNVLATELIKRGHNVTFLYTMRTDERNQVHWISGANYKRVDNILSLKCLPANSVLIIDDYQLSQAQWLHCCKITFKLMFYNDGEGQPNMQVDLAVNMNDQKDEHQIGKTNLNGAKFRLIRNQITQYRDFSYPHELNLQELTVTVMLGANDAKGVMPSVCENIIAFNDIKHVKILTTLPKDVVIEDLLKAEMTIDKVEVITNADDLGLEMKSCHFAICAAGGALYEYLSIGVPTIALVVADNQSSALHSVSIKSSCILLDNRTQFDIHAFKCAIKRLVNEPQERQRLSHLASGLFDGLGAQRTVDVIESTLY